MDICFWLNSTKHKLEKIESRFNSLGLIQGRFEKTWNSSHKKTKRTNTNNGCPPIITESSFSNNKITTNKIFSVHTFKYNVRLWVQVFFRVFQNFGFLKCFFFQKKKQGQRLKMVFSQCADFQIIFLEKRDFKRRSCGFFQKEKNHTKEFSKCVKTFKINVCDIVKLFELFLNHICDVLLHERQL